MWPKASRIYRQRLPRCLNRVWAPAYLVLFAIVLIVQLLLPPAVGLTDNGDSGRLAGDLKLIPNYPVGERFFQYFTPDYLRPDARTVWAPGMIATGRLVVRAAAWIGFVKPPGHFDLRWIGFIHMWIFLLCFGFLLIILNDGPALVRWTVPAAAIWIFGDVAYVAYLNSFYLDAMGLLCFLLVAVTAYAILKAGAPQWAIVYFFASAAFAASKPLNAPSAALIGAVVAASCWFQPRSGRRSLGVAAGVSASVIALVTMVATTASYQYPALVNVVMLRIAKTPEGPASLTGFGLLPADMRYAGKDAFRADGPGADAGFAERFHRGATWHVVRWYLLHPGETLGFLQTDLLRKAWSMRPLRDLEKQASPDFRSHDFSSWSDLRVRTLKQWPAFTPAIYAAALVLGLAPWVSRRWREFREYGLFVDMLALLGILQFCCGSLLDAIETSRHLFMFHAGTDALLLTLFAGSVWLVSARLRRAGPS